MRHEELRQGCRTDGRTLFFTVAAALHAGPAVRVLEHGKQVRSG